MSYYSRPGRGGSKAGASTVCQKCLQRGHYSYECKSAAQERPYASRPSRSQQFLNPKLRPQLSNAAPSSEIEKKGTADAILSKNEEERRKRRALEDDSGGPVRKRSRSRSRSRSYSYSSRSSSVSTISTTRSSRSPPARNQTRADRTTHVNSSTGNELAKAENGSGKRRRRSTSSTSSQHDTDDLRQEFHGDRNTRARKRSRSPLERGRRNERSHKNEQNGHGANKFSGFTGDRVEETGTEFTGVEGRYNVHDDGKYQHNRHKDGLVSVGLSGVASKSDRREERELSPYSRRLALSRQNR